MRSAMFWVGEMRKAGELRREAEPSGDILYQSHLDRKAEWIVQDCQIEAQIEALEYAADQLRARAAALRQSRSDEVAAAK